MASSLCGILTPRSVAVIGASQAPGKVGATVLDNLVKCRFAGPIYPVSLHCNSVQGLKAYRSVADLPGPVDLAIVCTPAGTVPGLVRQCGEAGASGMIILAAGFREIGQHGRDLEDSIRSEAGKFKSLRIVGPNCLGVIVPGSRLNASFASTFPPPGRVAFISQSGALCTAVLDWASERALGFSHFVSVGNSLDVGMADLLDYLADDPATDAVILYIESIETARPFMSAAKACARRKPIIAYKAGRFAESAHAAASHTGAMAGVDSVYEAVFERAGIVRVFGVGDLFECAQLLAKGPTLQGERLAVLTNAGGPGVMACDALLERRGTLAHLSESSVQQLDQFLPPSWPRENPVDVLGDATPERFTRALQIVGEDSQVDAILAILTPQMMTDPTGTAHGLVGVARHCRKPILASWMGGPMVREGIEILNNAGVPTAATPNEAVSAFMNLVRYAHNMKLLYETPREVPMALETDRHRLREQLGQLFETDRDVLNEIEAKAFLKAYGIPVAEVREGHTADEVARLARSTGFPVVLKIVSPQITHKTDVGGVALNLMNEDQVRKAYVDMIASVQQTRPDADVRGVSVQSMVKLPGGMELIIGSKKDPVFGPVIMVGLGGIGAELYQDCALGLPPLNERFALHMLKSLRTWPLVNGYRGRKAVANVDRLVEILLRFSMLVSDFPEIRELDANPLLVRGDQAIALDARIMVDRRAVEKRDPRPYAHLAIRPYPDELVERTKLADGVPITLRPIKPEDEPLWHELLASCSRESLRARFQFAFKTDMHEAATRFCFVDYDRELTVVAEGDVDGARRLTGVARLVSDVNSGRAEFGVLVGDPWQGRGLGNLLTAYCVKNVDRSQVHEIYAVIGRTNSRMIRVFNRNGFDIGPASDPTLFLAAKKIA
jgi:acetyltransferase